MFLLARLHIVYRGSIVLHSVVRRRLSSFVTLHGGPAGGLTSFTRAGQAMTSRRLQSTHSSTVTLHGGPVVLRLVRATRFSSVHLLNVTFAYNILDMFAYLSDTFKLRNPTDIRAIWLQLTQLLSHINLY